MAYVTYRCDMNITTQTVKKALEISLPHILNDEDYDGYGGMSSTVYGRPGHERDSDLSHKSHMFLNLGLSQSTGIENIESDLHRIWFEVILV